MVFDPSLKHMYVLENQRHFEVQVGKLFQIDEMLLWTPCSKKLMKKDIAGKYVASK